MAKVFILDGDGNSLNIDCTIKDSRSFSATLTQKPIGNGIAITDSKIIESAKYSIEGIITNTPNIDASDFDITISPSGGLLKIISQLINGNTTLNSQIKVANVDDSTRVLDANSYLDNLLKSKKVFSLFIHGYDEIDNLQVTEYRPEFSADNGESLTFSLEMQQIKIVGTKTTMIPKGKIKSKIAVKKIKGTEPLKKDETTAKPVYESKLIKILP